MRTKRIRRRRKRTRKQKGGRRKGKEKRKKTASKWKYDKCSPNKENEKTCFTDDSLLKLRDHWNMRHPDAKINTNNPNEIWNNLQNFMKNTCNRESCWLRQNFMKNNLSKELTEYTFAPTPPKVWRKKPNEWLTSIEILQVMKQWERKHKNFEFIGPSPIDYDKHISHGECVWEELCRFNLENYIKRGITKIGIVFNTDPHDKEGSHWVAAFINIKRREVYYFDSYGERISKFINRFVKNKVIKQGKKLNMDFKFFKNTKRHQYKTSECGMYCLYFIIKMIEDKITFEELMSEKIKDDSMLKLRKEYFNF
jgi:hypothetical protein